MSDDQAAEKLKILTDEDGITVFADVSSDEIQIEYSEQWLESQLIQQGYAGLSVSKSAHEKIEQLFTKNQPGRVTLGPKIDAQVEVKISNDTLTAYLQITAAKGGNPAGSKEIVNALNSQNCDLNLVNKNRVVDLVEKSQVIEPGEVIEILIAEGRTSKDGRDTQFECLVDNITDRKPNERDDGTIDYYDLGEIPCIEAGIQLMKKIPPVPAKNGRSVTGHELLAKKGKTLNFKKCQGAGVSPIDPDILISTIKGQPVLTQGGVKVDSLLIVKNVDLHTGHIDYDGSVVVKGDVASKMKIKVTGDVQVFGMVENATIEAGGNIDIKLGAIGRADSPKAEDMMQINCKGNLTAGYLENVQADIQGDILIKSRISNSEIKAGHQIIVGNRQQEKSGIVGGHVTAGSVIRAEVLGSSAGTLTGVSIACSEDILKQHEDTQQQIVEHEETLGKMLELMVALSKKRNEKAKELLDKVKKDTEEFKLRVNNLIKQKYEIEALIEHTGSGKVIVQKEAHPGVTIKIMLQDQQIKSRYGQGAFLLYEDSMSFNSVMA